MNFEIVKKEFIKGLGLMQGVSGRKTTLPILSHILLEWDKNALFLTGTDLETGIREEIMVKTYQKGSASVSAKKLSGLRLRVIFPIGRTGTNSSGTNLVGSSKSKSNLCSSSSGMIWIPNSHSGKAPLSIASKRSWR